MLIKPTGKKPLSPTFSKRVGAGSKFYVPLNSKGPGIGNLIQGLAFSNDELIMSIGNSLKMHNQEMRASKTILGRFIALFSRSQDPNWIEIDGTRLIQLFQLSSTEPPVTLSPSKTYYVEVTGLRQMLEAVAN